MFAGPPPTLVDSAMGQVGVLSQIPELVKVTRFTLILKLRRLRYRVLDQGNLAISANSQFKTVKMCSTNALHVLGIQISTPGRVLFFIENVTTSVTLVSHPVQQVVRMTMPTPAWPANRATGRGYRVSQCKHGFTSAHSHCQHDKTAQH